MTTGLVNTEIDAFLGQSPIPLFVDGEWRSATDGGTVDVLRPSDGTLLATVASATEADVDTAVNAAARALPDWSALDVRDRAVLLHRWADAIERESAMMVELESRDIGKPFRQTEDWDIRFATEGFRYFADVAVHTKTRDSLPLRRMDGYRTWKPRGVCGFIIPWNAPIVLFAWGTAPALVAGNTVVVKAAELAPLSCLYMCKLAEEVGIPHGVLNVVPGLGEIAGAALARHERLNMISFTGSPATGKRVAEAAARNLVPSKLELGGKGAAVIFPDVDVHATANALADAIVRNAGQTCCTATRWMIHEAIFDDFVDAATAVLSGSRIGPDTDEHADYGALISEAQRSRVLGYLEEGVDQGAQVILEGGPAHVEGYESGFYVRPSLLTGPASNVCAREEIFGPAAYVMSFRDEDAVVELVNSSAYGLANSVWTKDARLARRVAERMVAGNNWINAHNIFQYGLPYGGVNLSGWGGGVNSQETYFDYQRAITIAEPLE